MEGVDTPQGYPGMGDDQSPTDGPNGQAPTGPPTHIIDRANVEAVLMNKTEPGLVFQFALGDQVYDPVLLVDPEAVADFIAAAGAASANVVALLLRQRGAAAEEEPQQGVLCHGGCGSKIFGDLAERGFCNPCFEELSPEDQARAATTEEEPSGG